MPILKENQNNGSPLDCWYMVHSYFNAIMEKNIQKVVKSLGCTINILATWAGHFYRPSHTQFNGYNGMRKGSLIANK